MELQGLARLSIANTERSLTYAYPVLHEVTPVTFCGAVPVRCSLLTAAEAIRMVIQAMTAAYAHGIAQPTDG